jgi:peptide/nickel transport system ATP-binding protein
MFLHVNRLCVEYKARDSVVAALTDIEFALPKGSTLGLVGESGCGKTTLALAILDLLPAAGSIRSGSICLDGKDLVQASPEQRRKGRWTQIAYVPQGAANSLDPVQTIWSQFKRIAAAHGRKADKQLRTDAEQLFQRVQLAAQTLDRYPHQLSGGMRQRALMALALLFKPQLLIADEPTTGLDVIVQRQVLQLLRHLQQEEQMTVVIVSHDIGVIAETARYIAVMYAGRIVESGPTREVLSRPLHPYSMGLREAFPDIRKTARAGDQFFGGIPGAPPRLDHPVQGCPFAPRCPFAQPVCTAVTPQPREFGSQRVACHFAEDADLLRARSAAPGTWAGALQEAA